jgi:LCP family protein required for cell wall assembly
VRVLGAFAVVLLGLVGVLVAASAWTASNVSRDVERLPDVFPQGDRPAPVPGSLTFLLVGLDTSPGSTPGGEPDMIGLGHVTEDRSHLQMVSMPANLWVDETDESSGTLRDAFDRGGPQQMIAAVEAVSGIRVDHYADLDLEAFSALTEALGGITVDVPDQHQSRGQHFTPGEHQFDGDEALAYMRSPRLEPDEVAAVPRQQQVIKALYERVREQGLLSNLGRLSGLIGLLTRSLRVDDTMDDAFLTGLAWDLRDAGAPDLFTVPVKPVAEHGGVPVHPLDRQRAEVLFTYLRTDLLDDHKGEFT